MEEHSMLHLKFNYLASIWIDTTGRRAGYDSLVRICVMILDNFLEPSQKVMPFYVDIVPKRPENIPQKMKGTGINRENLLRIMQDGMEAYLAADRFEEWFQTLALKWGKKILPLVHDWPFVRDFLIDWLGWENFSSYFGTEYRDTHVSCNYSNDKANLLWEPCQYPKSIFRLFCSQLKIPKKRFDEPIQNCVTLAKVYKAMLGQRF